MLSIFQLKYFLIISKMTVYLYPTQNIINKITVGKKVYEDKEEKMT